MCSVGCSLNTSNLLSRLELKTHVISLLSLAHIPTPRLPVILILGGKQDSLREFSCTHPIRRGFIKVFRLLFSNGWIFKLNVLKQQQKRKLIREKYSTASRVNIIEVKAQESFFEQCAEQLSANLFCCCCKNPQAKH